MLGPNGASKSTLMKTISGVLDIEEGEISFNGTSLSVGTLDAKKKIGFLPENNPLYTEMYVREYLELVADIHHISKQRIDEVIDLVE